VAALLLAAGARSARAQKPADRPSEQEMFGGTATPAPAPPAAPVTTPATGSPAPAPGTPAPTTEPPGSIGAGAAAGDVRDRALLSGPEGEPQHLSDYQAPENPLQIGGQIYLRAQTSAAQGQVPNDWRLTSPGLLDVYLDGRPNPRVRAFVLWRTSYDPTAPLAAPPVSVNGLMAGSNGSFVGTSATGFTTFSSSRGPNSILDQMWIRFDIAERVFVTAGKQHVRWGTGRFWQPTDYLHLLKRNPLDVFDARPGTSMLKLHVPWEEKGWNFYAFAVTEDPNLATDFVSKIAGALRSEIVIGGAEVGLDALFKNGQRPRLGVDVSTGIYDFDLYLDAAIRAGSDFAVVSRDPNAPNQGLMCVPDPANGVPAGSMVNDLSAQYKVGQAEGVQAQVVGGVNWSRKYNDNDMLTLGAEYFYNQPGYSDSTLYPGLLFNQLHQPQLNFFYTGKHYGAVYLLLPAPYSWNYTTFTLSTLSNISDLSFVSRLDYAVTILTHLSVEAFAAVHYGNRSGEFRLGFDVPAQFAPAPGTPPGAMSPINCVPTAGPFTNAPALLDLGIALRLKI
jgi:hypothetical protein